MRTNNHSLLPAAAAIAALADKQSLPLIRPVVAEEPDLLQLMDFFSLDHPDEAILLAWFLANRWPEKLVDLVELLEGFGKDIAALDAHIAALDGLCQKGLLMTVNAAASHRDLLHSRFYLPRFVLEAALQGNHYALWPQSFSDFRSFLAEVFNVLKRRMDKEIDAPVMTAIIAAMEKAHPHLPELQQLLAFQLPDQDRILLYGLLRERLVEDDLWLELKSVFRPLFPDPMLLYHELDLFRKKAHILQKHQLLDLDEEYADRAVLVRVTQACFDILLPGQVAIRRQLDYTFDTTDPNTITDEKLYFNEQEASELELVGAALQPDRMDALQQSLRAAKLPPGLTILLYGHPGTGKTASVMQWARASGRVVLRVEIDQVRSKWLGESERNMRRLFDRYNDACRDYDRIPILLFNEADALFGKRLKVERQVDQVHNNLQNILLQSLEDFKGILVATTNMPGQFDPAFDRRFLYKLAFTRPNTSTRMQMLQDCFPQTDPEWLNSLNRQFELTGAQMRNLARRMLVEQVLRGTQPTREILLRAAEEELKLQQPQRNAVIGFQTMKQCG